MKKLAPLTLLAVALAAGGCFKQSAETAIKNDGSATVKISMSYKTEIVEKIKSQIDAAIEMMGDGNPEIAKAKERFDKIGDSFDGKKVGEEWKKLGVEVGKTAAIDKDGWKGFEAEGAIKSIADYNKKVGELKKPADDESMGGDPSKFAIPRFPKFYKTKEPNVAKVVMVWRDPSKMDEQMKQLENMPDEQRSQLEEGFDAQRGEMGIDDLKIEIKVKLPGKILSVSNAKQEGENTLVLEVLGSNISVDMLSKLGQLPSATMQFDPKEFKIPLEDEPKAAESKPASRPVEKPKKDEEEKKKDEDKDKDK